MMALQDLQTAAINEIFNNGGTANDFITPTMATRWINFAQYKLWQNFVMNDISYFAFYDRTLTVVSTTTTPYVLQLPEDVHSVLSMAFALNTASATQRQPVPALTDTRERSYITANYLPIDEVAPSFMWQEGPTAIVTGAAYGGSLSTNYFARSVILTPSPQVSGTLYYDGQRLPVELINLTDICEVPRDCLDFIVWETILYADLRDKVFRQEVFKKRDMCLKDAVSTHKKGVQKQQTARVRRNRWG